MSLIIYLQQQNISDIGNAGEERGEISPRGVLLPN